MTNPCLLQYLSTPSAWLESNSVTDNPTLEHRLDDIVSGSVLVVDTGLSAVPICELGGAIRSFVFLEPHLSGEKVQARLGSVDGEMTVGLESHRLVVQQPIQVAGSEGHWFVFESENHKGSQPKRTSVFCLCLPIADGLKALFSRSCEGPKVVWIGREVRSNDELCSGLLAVHAGGVGFPELFVEELAKERPANPSGPAGVDYGHNFYPGHPCLPMWPLSPSDQPNNSKKAILHRLWWCLQPLPWSRRCNWASIIKEHLPVGMNQRRTNLLDARIRRRSSSPVQEWLAGLDGAINLNQLKHGLHSLLDRCLVYPGSGADISPFRQFADTIESFIFFDNHAHIPKPFLDGLKWPTPGGGVGLPGARLVGLLEFPLADLIPTTRLQEKWVDALPMDADLGPAVWAVFQSLSNNQRFSLLYLPCEATAGIRVLFPNGTELPHLVVFDCDGGGPRIDEIFHHCFKDGKWSASPEFIVVKGGADLRELFSIYAQIGDPDFVFEASHSGVERLLLIRKVTANNNMFQLDSR